MKAQPIIEVHGKKYMSTKAASELWDMSQKTIASYCREKIIRNAFKTEKNHWYIWIDEIKPLTNDVIHKVLVFSLELKNNSDREINWQGLADPSVLEPVYKQLVHHGYINDFQIADMKRIPYEITLTQKGMEMATKYQREKTYDFKEISMQLLQLFTALANLASPILKLLQ